MTIEPITFILKDGRSATLRCADPENRADAEGLLHYLQTVTAETPYLLRTAEECQTMTVDGEVSFIRSNNDSPDSLMLVCIVDGKIAGNCDIRFSGMKRCHHRGNIGIAICREYWNLGIGTAMFQALETFARSRPDTRQMELDFIEGNSRARGLYEKMGFRITGIKPDAILYEDGTMVAEYSMMKKL